MKILYKQNECMDGDKKKRRQAMNMTMRQRQGWARIKIVRY